MEYVIINGQRKNIRKAYAQGLTIFNGGLVEPLSANFTASNGTVVGGWSIDTLLTSTTPTTTYQTRAVGTANKINVTNYNTLHVVMEDNTEYTANITAYSGEKYIVLCNTYWGANYGSNFEWFLTDTTTLGLMGNVKFIENSQSQLTLKVKTIYLT